MSSLRSIAGFLGWRSASSSPSSSAAPILNRRTFLAGSMAIAVAAVLPKPAEAAPVQPQPRRPLVDDITPAVLAQSTTPSTEWTYGHTLFVTIFLEAPLGMGLSYCVNRKGLRWLIRDREPERFRELCSRWEVVQRLFLAPFYEEMLFRELPARIFTESGVFGSLQGAPRWDVGVVSALLFGWIHPAMARTWRFIPVEQSMFGCYAWWLMRHHGFSHNLLAHAVHNGTHLAFRQLSGYEALFVQKRVR